MLTFEGARLQVFLELRRLFGLRTGANELVIADENTRELPIGWMFFYTTRGRSDGDMRCAVAGNLPILINREDGSMRHVSLREINALAKASEEFQRRTNPMKSSD